jgi:glycine cleavage system H protein
MSFPADRKYTRSHEWALTEGSRVRVGVTSYAQESLGDVIHIDLPTVGTKAKAGGPVAEIESVKAVSDIYAPVSGTVVAVNETLDGNEAVINQDPHGAGWLFKIKLADAGEVGTLLDSAAYAATLH